MQYAQAQLGRVFIARFDDGEDLLAGLRKVIIDEGVEAAIVHLLGASAASDVVLGPEERAYPPKPSWWKFDDAREIVGTAIVALDNGEPKIHLHCGIGHHSESKTGCIRNNSKVYLTVEAVIQELTGSGVSRKLDERYNAGLLSF